MRIFIGLSEIADNVASLASGFRALGHETYSVVWQKNRFYPDNQYDVVLNDRVGVSRPTQVLSKRILARIKWKVFMLSQFLHALATCDVFMFIFGSSFLPRYFDYPVLKLFSKRITSLFCGSDIRYWYAYQQEAHSLGIQNEVKPFIDFLKDQSSNYFVISKRVRVAERYADLILSDPGMGQLQSRPYMRFNIPLDLSQYRFHLPEREVPLVLHAPSKRGVKGTDFVLAAVEQLKRDGIQFEFRLIENMPNAQVRELLAEADIVIDQLFSQTLARLALESMATGNVTLARFQPKRLLIPPDCPAVNVTMDTLTAKLREVILNRELRLRLACSGRPYVEKHHSHVHVAQQILDWLKPGGIQNYDFVPTFFQNEFVMPPELLKEERRKIWEHRWQHLKNCFSLPLEKDELEKARRKTNGHR